MAGVKQYKDFNIEFGPNDGHKWSLEKLAETDGIAEEIAHKRSPKMKLKNRVHSISYRMEEYICPFKCPHA